jgi:hypothetical protein
MSLVEQARTRLTEVQSKVRSRVEAIKGGAVGASILKGGAVGASILSGNMLGQARLEFPKIKEIREKGPVAVLQERFPRLKEIRAGGLLKPEKTVSTQAVETAKTSVISEGVLKKESRNISIEL